MSTENQLQFHQKLFSCIRVGCPQICGASAAWAIISAYWKNVSCTNCPIAPMQTADVNIGRANKPVNGNFFVIAAGKMEPILVGIIPCKRIINFVEVYGVDLGAYEISIPSKPFHFRAIPNHDTRGIRRIVHTSLRHHVFRS